MIVNHNYDPKLHDASFLSKIKLFLLKELNLFPAYLIRLRALYIASTSDISYIMTITWSWGKPQHLPYFCLKMLLPEYIYRLSCLNNIWSIYDKFFMRRGLILKLLKVNHNFDLILKGKPQFKPQVKIIWHLHYKNE